MLKLRQLPKIVSKLLIYLRTQTNLDLAWNKQDLELLDRPSKVPRVQSIEILEDVALPRDHDCAPSSGESAGTAFWRVGAIAEYRSPSPISDHIPEPWVY